MWPKREEMDPLWGEKDRTSPTVERPGYQDEGNLWPSFATTKYVSLGFYWVLILQRLG